LSATFDTIKALLSVGKSRVSDHCLKEMRDDGIDLSDVIAGIDQAVVVEDYPNFAKGPCVLCLQLDRDGKPLHILWGLALKTSDVATIITAYRPDPARWSADFLNRRPK